jgi:hypothetical protein
VHNIHLNSFLLAPQVKVGVCGGTERVSNDKETDVGGLGLFDHLSTSTFNKFSVGQDDIFLEQFF